MSKTYLAFCLLLLLLVNPGNAAFAKGEVTIDALKHKEFQAKFQFEELRYQRELFSGTLMSYLSDGLKVYALVNRPAATSPEAGYPVLIFGHGFHPEPKKYGISSNGEISRPGDYYRGIPESYAEQGFLVVTPDYRGHNRSEGFEFTKTSYLASSYYAGDVLHVLAALPSLDNIDLSRVYFLGHSMGGDVGLKVLLASNTIRAASFWSPVAATTDQQALYYGKYYDKTNAPADQKVDSDTFLQYTKKIDKLYAALPGSVTKQQVDPVNHLNDLSTPVVIHHARGDTSVPYTWSENLVVQLKNANKEFEFHAYDSDNHLFAEANRKKAVRRDINFFNAH